MKRNILNAFIIISSLVVLLVFVFRTQGVDALLRQLKGLNYSWIGISLLFMLLYWSFEAMMLHAITRFHSEVDKLYESFSITMVGQFFNSITPFATGGQPAQIFYMVKKGIDTANASTIVMTKFVIYQSTLTLYSLLVILFTFTSFSPGVPLLLTMTVLGMGVHVVMLLIVVLFSYNRVLTAKITGFTFRLLKKVRVVKDSDSAKEKLESFLKSFYENARYLKNNPGFLLRTSLLVFIQLTFFFAIPYCIYRSFGLSGASFISLFAAAVFIATIISIVPLPGSSGGAEGGFYLFLSNFFSGNAIIPAILIWRIITYYSCIGIGVLFTLISPKRIRRAET